MIIREKTVLPLALLIMILPYGIFAIGWLNPLFVVISLIAIFLSLYLVFRTIPELDFEVEITPMGCVILLITAILMTWLSGVGGGYPESSDIYMRNAIYRDLIVEKWPVFYRSTNRALVYYFGYWMVPALISKASIPFLGGNALWAFSRVVLFVYTLCFVLVIETALFVLVSKRYQMKIVNGRRAIKVCLMLMFWGGLSIIGIFFSQGLSTQDNGWWQQVVTSPLMMEHYTDIIACENGNLIQMMNVYNQCLPAWLAAILFLLVDEREDYYGIICLSLAFSAPFAMVGLALMMGIRLIIGWRNHTDSINKKVFSPLNFCSLYFLGLIALFYKSGDSVETGLHFKYVFSHMGVVRGIAAVVLFCFLTFGIFGVLCKERRHPFFLACEALNVLLIFVYIGSPADFIMRATIPLNVFFMVCSIGLLLDESDAYRERKNILLVVMGIVAVVPIMQIGFHADMAIDSGTLAVQNDSLYSLSYIAGNGDHGLIGQYTSINPSDSFFFRHIARGDYGIDHPVLEYNKDTSGKAYIQAISLADNMADELRANSSYEMGERIEETGIRHVTFDKDEIFPKIYSTLQDVAPGQVELEWLNQRIDFYDNPYGNFVAIKLHNHTGKTISYCDKIANPGIESGVSVELLDKNGESFMYPYAYEYTRHVVYPEDEEFYMIWLPYPDEPGEYNLRFCFFYTDMDGVNRLTKDTNTYRVVFK